MTNVIGHPPLTSVSTVRLAVGVVQAVLESTRRKASRPISISFLRQRVRRKPVKVPEEHFPRFTLDDNEHVSLIATYVAAGGAGKRSTCSRGDLSLGS